MNQRSVDQGNQLFRQVGAAVLCAMCQPALAQFGASGGASRDVDLLVKLPWIAVAVVIASGWWGPRALRPPLRRASKQAFAVFFLVAAALFVGLLAVRAMWGPNTDPLLLVGGLLVAALVFSGACITALMAASLGLQGARVLWRRQGTPRRGD